MIAVRRFTKEQMDAKLAPYGCRRTSVLEHGLEIWETGWGTGFTLMVEDGYYDEWQFRQLLANVIAKTMPPEWNGHGPS